MRPTTPLHIAREESVHVPELPDVARHRGRDACRRSPLGGDRREAQAPHPDLPGLAGCDLSLLLDEKQIAVAEYHAPKQIASQASVLKSGHGWIVSISGGVDVNSWAVLEKSELKPELATTRKAATRPDGKRWWWD